MPHFTGKKVCRDKDIFNPCKGKKYGQVIRCYSRPKKQVGSMTLGPYPELYDVRWNDGAVEKGFLPHGISAV